MEVAASSLSCMSPLPISLISLMILCLMTAASPSLPLHSLGVNPRVGRGVVGAEEAVLACDDPLKMAGSCLLLSPHEQEHAVLIFLSSRIGHDSFASPLKDFWVESGSW